MYYVFVGRISVCVFTSSVRVCVFAVYRWVMPSQLAPQVQPSSSRDHTKMSHDHTKLSHDPAERSSTATRWDDSSSLMHKQSSLWCF